jgi:hypothetical protein
MLDLSFKVRETTRSGKLLKTLLSKENISDAKILLSDACSVCDKVVKDVKESVQTIDCSICREKFHIPCLTYPLPSDFATSLSTNPCLWWFCATCVTKAEASNKPDVVNSCSDVTTDSLSSASEPQQQFPTNQVDFMKSISEQFSSFKEELMSDMNGVIENKLKSIIATESTSSKALYSSFFPTSPTSKSPTQSPTLVAQTSQVAQTPQAPIITQLDAPEVLVLSPKTDHSNINAETLASVRKFAGSQLKDSQVVFLRCNENNKKVSIGFPNADARDKAARFFDADKTLDSFGYHSKNVNKMLPKITIHGVSTEIFDGLNVEGAHGDVTQIRELEKHKIVTLIAQKNPSIDTLWKEGHTIQVVYLKRMKRNLEENSESEDITIGLKVSPLIHQVLFGPQQQGTIYLGNTRYQVQDRFFIKQCYHCQMIGHTSVDCKQAAAGKPPTCMYCMGNHRSSVCTNKRKKDEHQCARCLASQYPNDAENSKSHNAGFLQCPVLVRERNRIASHTDFTSKNVL